MYESASPVNTPPSHARKYVLTAVLRWQWLHSPSMRNSRHEQAVPKPKPANEDAVNESEAGRVGTVSIADADKSMTDPVVKVCLHFLIAGLRNAMIEHRKPNSRKT